MAGYVPDYFKTLLHLAKKIDVPVQPIPTNASKHYQGGTKSHAKIKGSYLLSWHSMYHI